MAKLDFDQLAFQYGEDGFPAVSSEAVLFIPALDASTYQDGTPIVENFYTQKRLHTEAFPESKLLHTASF